MKDNAGNRVGFGIIVCFGTKKGVVENDQPLDIILVPELGIEPRRGRPRGILSPDDLQ